MSHDPFDVDARATADEEAKARAKLAAKTDEDDTRWLMSSRRGRRIVRHLLERAGVFQLSFNTNALQMAFAEGRRNEGLALLAKLMSICPEQYTAMMKETDDG